jgi:transcriptional regulator
MFGYTILDLFVLTTTTVTAAIAIYGFVTFNKIANEVKTLEAEISRKIRKHQPKINRAYNILSSEVDKFLAGK